MYQSFESASHDQGATRLAALRTELSARGLAGFIVPRSDAHQGEYVPPRDERLSWLTGFTGSAGIGVVLMDAAGVFVDGRYTVQSAEQLDPTAYTPVPIEQTRPEAWLSETAPQGAVIGFDPWLMTAGDHERYRLAGEAAGFTLRAEETNPVDAIWPDQPPAPAGGVHPHPVEFAGVESAEKRAAIAETLRDEGLSAFVLTLPDSINWLLNIRGTDISHTPVVLAFAVIDNAGGVDLFLDPERMEPALVAHLGDTVRARAPSEFTAHLNGLSGKVGLDRTSAPVAVGTLVREGGAEVVWRADPCILPKALKNSAELAGSRAAHLRDGAAVSRFLCWFDRKAPGGELKEIKVAKRIERYRNETNQLQDISFDTIAAAGPHAALPHYRVNRESNATVAPDSLFLLDSGGQYSDGTTDITRTIAVGKPETDHIRMFTLVLKGMIAVSRMRFPAGTTGAQIDVLARSALWQSGFEFDHGTGHGVGAYLGVHEGPASLSKRGTVAIRPGMILSNEPGYYRVGGFGIRIENLLAVTEPTVPDGGEREMMGFETLTLAPIDLRLVDPTLLDMAETAWLDAYHARVYEALYPLVDATTQDWLEHVTQPLAAFVSRGA